MQAKLQCYYYLVFFNNIIMEPIKVGLIPVFWVATSLTMPSSK